MIIYLILISLILLAVNAYLYYVLDLELHLNKLNIGMLVQSVIFIILIILKIGLK